MRLSLLFWLPSVLVLADDDKKETKKKAVKVTHEVVKKTAHTPRPPVCQGEESKYVQCTKSESCPDCTPQDCKLDVWSDWSACMCEGLRERKRKVATANNECGVPCNGTLIETRTCNDIVCLHQPVNCSWDDKWSDWTTCEGDVTQSTRDRQYDPAKYGGQPCSGTLVETKACAVKNQEDRDCQWGAWADWGGCTCTCDGGQRSRDRHVAIAPRGSGKRCDARTKQELVPCNTQPCDCVPQDGTWDDWTEWSQCSKTCDGGKTFRNRARATEANECGSFNGTSLDVKDCNTEPCKVIDCEFDQWSDWSSCSCTCEGIKHRYRSIKAFGKNNGKWCNGAMKEVDECNRYTHRKECFGPPATDCVMKWSDWSECSVSCDGGNRTRIRDIITPNANGGNPCNGTTQITEPCNTQSCQGAVDCKWAEWSKWGACDKCGGQKRRYRSISVMPKHMGKPCAHESSEETTNCTRKCHEAVVCEWGSWAEKGDCSASCGVGWQRMTRIRKLQKAQPTTTTTTLKPTTTTTSITCITVTEVVATEEPEKLYIYDKDYDQSQDHVQGLLVGFAMGAVVSGLAFAAVIRINRSRNRDRDLMLSPRRNVYDGVPTGEVNSRTPLGTLE